MAKNVPEVLARPSTLVPSGSETEIERRRIKELMSSADFDPLDAKNLIYFTDFGPDILEEVDRMMDALEYKGDGTSDRLCPYDSD